MKKALLLAVSLLCAGSLWAQPALKLAQDEQSMGRIPERGGIVVREYRFINAGDQPLVILAVEVSCTCTRAEFSKKPFLPGEEGVITVKYNPRRQQGKVYKALQVFSNDPRGRQLLFLTGEVF